MYLIQKTITIVFICCVSIIGFAQQQRPNIVFILADDLGWMDVGYNGSEYYETPNLDALSKKGVVFNRAYAAAPVCAPTRGSIMSGKYPATSGYTGLPGQVGRPAKGKLVDAPSLPALPLDEIALSRVLRDNGYSTWHVGKWHVGEGAGHSPVNYGFEKEITGYEGAKWVGKRFRQNDNMFITDHLTDTAMYLIENRDDKPFFLNLWYYAVHTPIKAKAADIAYFEEKAKRMGLDTINPFVEGENYPANPWFDKDRMNKRISRRKIQSNPVYAAFVYCLDYNVGRLVAKLEEENLMENTIFIFFSDNGGLSSAEGSPTCNAPLREGKGWMYEGGFREPCIFYWKDKIGSGVINQPVVSTDFYPTILDLAGLEQLPNQHTDGVSIKPLLTGQDTFSRGPIFWHSPHYFNNGGYPFSAITDGDWKYMFNYHSGKAELYNLMVDPSERKNLIDSRLDKAMEMEKELNNWLETLNPKFPEPNTDSKQ
ncbi:sulfatase [Draconibacterium sediminis]|uniref:sulfatase n=1 Tax=Draconibacterium sediminis TaxID=1544798 RepID=UPI0018DD21FF|nr:sulfatase [Draconibacterium sediminis]